MLKRCLLVIALILSAMIDAQAQSVTDQTQMVTRSVSSVQRLRMDQSRKDLINRKLGQARAVLIVPDLVKGGFFLGAEYGTGVLLTRGRDGLWSGPAFYSIASGSFGIQIGLQDSEALFVIMTDNGLYAVMNDKMKLGASANVAVAVIGMGAEADTTTNAGADIYAFSSAAGLYAGVSLQGSGIIPRHVWNAAYYGSNPSPDDILIRRSVDNRQADRLRDALTR